MAGRGSELQSPKVHGGLIRPKVGFRFGGRHKSQMPIAIIRGAAAGTSLFLLASSTSVAAAPRQDPPDPVIVKIAVESEVDDVPTEAFKAFVMATLNDPRSWGLAGIQAADDPSAEYRVVLAEPADVDEYCAPLKTNGSVSCQNGPIVALNAKRWREASDGWDSTLELYRQYLVNHEVGHLFGQFHPAPRCPAPGRAAAVMEQQTKGLEGCIGNSWPLWWEIELAKTRPLTLAPAPDLEHADPVNLGGAVTAPVATVPPTTVPDEGLLETTATTAPVSVTTNLAAAPTAVPISAAALDAAREESSTSAVSEAGNGPLLWFGGALLLLGLGVGFVTWWRLARTIGNGGGAAAFSQPADALHYGTWHFETRFDDPLSITGDGFALILPPGAQQRSVEQIVHAVDGVRRSGCAGNDLGDAIRASLRVEPSLRPRAGQGLAVAVDGADGLTLVALGSCSIDRTGRLRPPKYSNLVWRVMTERSVSGDCYVLRVPDASGAERRVEATFL